MLPLPQREHDKARGTQSESDHLQALKDSVQFKSSSVAANR